MIRCSAISGDVFARHEIETHDESCALLDEACSGIPEGLPNSEPVIAAEEDILYVHTHPHVNMIREFSSHGGQHFIDQSTYVKGETFEVASFAAGATNEAVPHSIDGKYCFALVLPTGHHAEPNMKMVFCIFNNAAIAASVTLDRVERVAIIDWDLHHGNGTQKIFYTDERMLYCCIHQGNIFPDTGWVDEIGSGNGK